MARKKAGKKGKKKVEDVVARQKHAAVKKLLPELKDISVKGLKSGDLDYMLESWAKLDLLKREIMSIQSPISESEEGREVDETLGTDFTHFNTWLQENGCFPSENVRFGPTSKGCNGVICSRDLAEDEVVFQVPRKAMITLDGLHSHSHGDQSLTLVNCLANDPLVRRMHMLSLVLVLLDEVFKGQDSFFYRLVLLLKY